MPKRRQSYVKGKGSAKNRPEGVSAKTIVDLDEQLDISDELQTEKLRGVDKGVREGAQLLFGLAGIYFAFEDVKYKLTDIAKLIDTTFFLKIFAQGLVTGFESQVSQMVIGAEADPARLKKAPDNEPSPLEKIHERVAESIFKEEKDTAKFLLDTFNLSFKARMDAFERAEEGLVEGGFSGDDFVFLPTKEAGALSRRFRSFYKGKYSYKKRTPDIAGFISDLDNRIYSSYLVSDRIIAYGSAAGSTLLVAVDSLGKFFGREFAKLNVQFFNVLHPAVTLHMAKAALFTVFLYSEILNFAASWSKYLVKGAYNMVYYPVISGIMMGLYEEMERMSPAAFPKLRKELQKEAKREISTPPVLREVISLIGDLEFSYKKARKHLEKYDALLERPKDLPKHVVDDQRMYRTLVKNVTSAKRFLEARYIALSFFKKTAFTREYILPVLLELRAFPLMLKVFTSKIIFEGTKSYTKHIARPTLNVCRLLTDSMSKLFAKAPKLELEIELKEQPKDWKVPKDSKRS